MMRTVSCLERPAGVTRCADGLRAEGGCAAPSEEFLAPGVDFGRAGRYVRTLNLVTEGTMRKASPNLVRDLNRSAILRLIGREGPIARAEIARRLALSPATV